MTAHFCNFSTKESMAGEFKGSRVYSLSFQTLFPKTEKREEVILCSLAPFAASVVD